MYIYIYTHIYIYIYIYTYIYTHIIQVAEHERARTHTSTQLSIYVRRNVHSLFCYGFDKFTSLYKVMDKPNCWNPKRFQVHSFDLRNVYLVRMREQQHAWIVLAQSFVERLLRYGRRTLWFACALLNSSIRTMSMGFGPAWRDGFDSVLVQRQLW